MVENRQRRTNTKDEFDAPLAFRTRSAQGGRIPSSQPQPLAPAIDQGTVYGFPNAASADAWFAAGLPVYARDGLPNVRAIARAVADLEGTEDAYATPSGMAAISLTLLTILSAGDHVVTAGDCYRDTQALLTEHLNRFGIASSFVDVHDVAALRAAMRPTTRVILVETISNPGIELADLPAIADLTHAAGALLCVDNTLASPALCRPHEHGADLIVESVGKFLAGHHDVTAGAVAGPRLLVDRIRRAGYLFGTTLSPFDAWLALRGIKTLAPRMSWMCATAVEVARFLSNHPAVTAVRYPGLADGPRQKLVRRLLPDGAGAVLAFDVLGGPSAAPDVIRRLRSIPYAPSLGGPATLVSFPPQPDVLDDNGVPQAHPYGSATIRLSIGLEAAPDLIADLAHALDSPPTAREEA